MFRGHDNIKVILDGQNVKRRAEFHGIRITWRCALQFCNSREYRVQLKAEGVDA